MTLESLPAWAALPAGVLLMAGGLCTLIGSLGLARLGEFIQRMHGPSMGNTLGTGCVLMASILVSSALAKRPIVHELLITVFVVTTAPMTAMLLMRAAVHRSSARTDSIAGDHAQRIDTVQSGISTPGRRGHGGDD